MNNIRVYTIENDIDFLRKKSKPVIFPDKTIENDINVLANYFDEDDNLLALASVQLGILKRIIYLKNTNIDLIRRQNKNEETEDDKEYNEKRVLINPEVISKEGLTSFWEACASCLDNVGLVFRPYKIRVKYQDIEGIFHEETFEGFESTVLSHELDHLDGILHIDIAKEVLVMTREERKEFRKTHDYEIISKEGDFDELKMKEEIK